MPFVTYILISGSFGFGRLERVCLNFVPLSPSTILSGLAQGHSPVVPPAVRLELSSLRSYQLSRCAPILILPPKAYSSRAEFNEIPLLGFIVFLLLEVYRMTSLLRDPVKRKELSPCIIANNTIYIIEPTHEMLVFAEQRRF